MRHRVNAGLKLGQRLRNWSIIKPASDQVVEFAGLASILPITKKCGPHFRRKNILKRYFSAKDLLGASKKMFFNVLFIKILG